MRPSGSAAWRVLWGGAGGATELGSLDGTCRGRTSLERHHDRGVGRGEVRAGQSTGGELEVFVTSLREASRTGLRRELWWQRQLLWRCSRQRRTALPCARVPACEEADARATQQLFAIEARLAGLFQLLTVFAARPGPSSCRAGGSVGRPTGSWRMRRISQPRAMRKRPTVMETCVAATLPPCHAVRR